MPFRLGAAARQKRCRSRVIGRTQDAIGILRILLDQAVIALVSAHDDLRAVVYSEMPARLQQMNRRD